VAQISSIGSMGRYPFLNDSYAVLDRYSSTIDNLIQTSLSQNTANVYQQGLQCFQKFRQNSSCQEIWPLSVDHVINFTAYLVESGYAFASAKCYLSGLSFFINLHGWKNPAESFIVKKLMAGYKRSYVSLEIRKSITLNLLLRILDALSHLCYSNFEVAFFDLHSL
jgi:hypothetical protein